jgi:VRR-NUC domain
MSLKLNSKGVVVNVQTEDELQQSIIQWRDEIGQHKWPELAWLHHAANGGKLAGRNKNEILKNGAKRKSLGVVKGIPDLFLPYNNGVFSGLYIELKTAKGKLSLEQLNFRDFAAKNGFAWMCLRSLEDVVSVIESYMKVEKTK